MNQSMESEAERIFVQALELDAGERQRYISAACAGNDALKQEVEQLLRDAEAADAYFGDSFVGQTLIDPSGSGKFFERPGSEVGPYRLESVIGEGGFGVVWLARQVNPITRLVAIKVIKAGMDTREVLSRFDAERQALARMDHPNIARVLDAGTTTHGRPYFAMEWVRGIPITRFCEEQSLNAKQRLELFVDVCAAINHAHQKGVIHRDIKPSNVLVTAENDKPLVKVIDFGISKATEGKLTDHTLMTRIEQWVGTPTYMSPEQAGLGNQDIDTRSDIYGLGVLLYEILTGQPPFDQKAMMRAGMDEMRRIIREEEPMRPSARISTQQAESPTRKTVANFHAERSASTISSELDWIVMKAIEKSRDRRYPTAAAFADDIRNFLNDEPVSAQPPNARYLLGKFVRRHRNGLRILAGSAALLIATTIFSVLQASKARKAEALAAVRLTQAVEERNAKSRALEDAEAVSRLLSEVFKRPDPDQDGSKVTVMEALDKASSQLDTELTGQPLRQAMLKKVLAGTYEQLALNDRAMKHWDDILGIYRKELGTCHDDTLAAMRKMIGYYEREKQFDRVLELAIEEEAALAKMPGNRHAEKMNSIRTQAEAHYRKGNVEQAKRMLEEMKARLTQDNGPLNTWELSTCEWYLNRFDQPPPEDDQAAHNDPNPSMAASQSPDEANQPASKQLERAYQSIREQYGERHLRSLDALVRLAEALFSEKRTDEALIHYCKAFKIAQEEFGIDHQVTLKYQSGFAWMNYTVGRSQEGLTLQRQLVNILRDTLGGAHAQTIEAEDWFLRWVFYNAWYDQGNNFLEQAYARRVKELGPDDLDTLSLEDSVAFRYFTYGKIREGQALAEHAVPLLRQKLGSEDRSTANAISTLARCYTGLGREREAMKLLEECCPHARDDTYINFLLAQLQIWFREKEAYHATRRWLIDYALTKMHQFHSQQDILRRVVFISCIGPLDQPEQKGQIKKIMDRVDEIQRSSKHILDLRNGNYWDYMPLGMMHTRLGNHEEAIRCYDEFLKYLPKGKLPDPDPWNRCTIESFKAISLLGLGKRDEAKQLIEQAGKLNPPLESEEHPLLGQCSHSGESLLPRIAHREAKELLEDAGGK